VSEKLAVGAEDSHVEVGDEDGAAMELRNVAAVRRSTPSPSSSWYATCVPS
jgi:hypothetical protein